MNNGTQQSAVLPPSRWIFFKNFHLAPLDDVTPEAVIHAARQACGPYRDRESLEPTTAQNYLASKLGAKGGLAGLSQEFEKKLRPFMKAHGLLTRADLITPRHDFPLVQLTPRRVADRLFQRDQPTPKRIFTGYDIDWYELNNRFYRSNPWRNYQEQHGKLFFLPFEMVMQKCDRLTVESSEAAAQCLDAAIAACDAAINPPANNLLGDQLLHFEDPLEKGFRFVPTLYQPASCPAEQFNEDVHRFHDVARLFREWAGRSGKGWVEVLPYNGSLVFLKGDDGNYDFLIPGFRDGPFEHNPFSPYLKNGDVPKSNDAYHFQRWLYFEYSGWLEEDEHHAEMEFYARGKHSIDYPRPEQILRTHLITVGKYRPPVRVADAVEGFYPCAASGRLLYISNLITIAEFRDFMRQNREYALYSRKLPRVDTWEPVNSDHDHSLPASVTWYDANAFASWISKNRHLPVRLLSANEYEEFARPLLEPIPSVSISAFLNMECDRLCCFQWPSGDPIEGHAPYMEESAFQELRLHFIPDAMKWKSRPDGLKILVSQHFGEWLNERAAALNTLTLSNIRYPQTPAERGFAGGRSTGKYISKKIGFRLCYWGRPEQENSIRNITNTK